MGELTLLILRIAFLGILWAFVFAVVYALRSDLFGQKVREVPAQAAARRSRSRARAAPLPLRRPPPGGQAIAKRLVITSGAKEGLELDLPGELLTIGRSGESGLVIRECRPLGIIRRCGAARASTFRPKTRIACVLATARLFACRRGAGAGSSGTRR